MGNKKAHEGLVDFAFTNYLSRFTHKDTSFKKFVKCFGHVFLNYFYLANIPLCLTAFYK
jgi:hypothetical protein